MWSTVLVMAVVAAADPVRVGVVAYMLSRTHPVRLLLSFFVAGFAANVAVAAAVVFGLRSATPDAGSTGYPALELGVGVLALAFAVLWATGVLEALVHRVRKSRATVPSGDQPPAPPTLDSLPVISKLPDGMKAALRGESPWAAGVLGLTNGIPNPYFVAAMAAALTAGVTVGQQMVALVVFQIVAFGAALVPLISFWIAPAATRIWVEDTYEWMKAHRRLVVTVIAGAVGVFFIGLGISHL